MSQVVRQTSFAAGEISPALYGRTDFAKLSSALRRCRNMFITPQGSAMNRSGSRYLGEIDSANDGTATRLIPFLYDNSQGYVIELGYWLRIWKNGVLLRDGGNVIIRLQTSYTPTDLPYVKHSQSGDTVVFTRKGFAPMVLTRISDTSWTWVPYSLARLIAPVLNVDCDGTAIDPPQAGSLEQHAYVVTAVDVNGNESTAVMDLTLPQAQRSIIVLTCLIGPGYRAPRIVWPATAGAVRYNVYRGRGAKSGIYGFIGSTSDLYYDDTGDVPPNYAQRPPAVTNPFVSEGPQVVAHYQQRILFADTPSKPNTIWGSALGDLRDFDKGVDLYLSEDQAFEFTLSSTKREEIRSLLPLRKLLAFTGGAEWQIDGSSGGALSPLSVDAVPHSHRGSAWLDPLVVGEAAIFLQQHGSVIRDVIFDFQVGGLQGSDLSIASRHLFDGYTVKDWTYQQVPYSIVWAVRNDGGLMGLTYIREHELVAWHRHDTDGAYQAVCSLGEGDEDYVYAIVRRTVGGVSKYFVERFTSRRIPFWIDPLNTANRYPDVRQMNFLDCSLQFDGTYNGWSLTPSSISGYTVHSTAIFTATIPSFVTTDVGDHIVFEANLPTAKRFKIVEWMSLTQVKVEFLQDVDPAYTWPTYYMAWARDTFSGLGHLEGRALTVLADGNVCGPYTVSGGKIVIDTPAIWVQAGLPYLSELEALELAVAGAELRSLYKRVRKASFEVHFTRGLLVGEDLSVLLPWKQREVSDQYGTIAPEPTTELAEVLIGTSWNKGGRAALRQKDPLPVAVLSVIREVELGGTG